MKKKLRRRNLCQCPQWWRFLAPYFDLDSGLHSELCLSIKHFFNKWCHIRWTYVIVLSSLSLSPPFWDYGLIKGKSRWLGPKVCSYIGLQCKMHILLCRLWPLTFAQISIYLQNEFILILVYLGFPINFTQLFLNDFKS